MVCEEKNSTVMVDLRQRECTVCQPSLEERLEVVDICDDVLTQDCQDDPLNPEPWSKFCDTNTSKVLNNGLTFNFEKKSLPETIAVDLVQQSLGPINDLLADTVLSRTNKEEDTIVVTTPRIKTSSKSRPRSQSETTEDVSEILKILTQKQTETRDSDNFFFGETSTSTPASRQVTGANLPSPSSSSVYFDPVLNTRPLPSQYQDTTQSSLTEFLNFQLQKQFSSPATPVRNSVTVVENQSSPKSEPSVRITTTKSDKDKFTAPVFEVETTAITSAESMTSSTILTTTTTTTSSVPLKTQKSQMSETNESQYRVTLTPSEVIQLCFLNSSYCDFSQNEVLVSNSETTTLLTTTPSTLEMEITVTRESSLLIAQREDIKDQIRKCFLTGECGDAGDQGGSGDQIHSPEEEVDTTTKALVSSTLSSRDTALRKRVKERARACLFEGKCN